MIKNWLDKLKTKNLVGAVSALGIGFLTGFGSSYAAGASEKIAAKAGVAAAALGLGAYLKNPQKPECPKCDPADLENHETEK